LFPFPFCYQIEGITLFVDQVEQTPLAASGTTGLARRRANLEQVSSDLTSLHRPRSCSRLKVFPFDFRPCSPTESIASGQPDSRNPSRRTGSFQAHIHSFRLAGAPLSLLFGCLAAKAVSIRSRERATCKEVKEPQWFLHRFTKHCRQLPRGSSFRRDRPRLKAKGI
jgi:hypothetical protein